MNEINNFSKNIWKDIINFQWTGWNISYKDDGYLYIKSSWYKINDIYLNNTLSKIYISWFNTDISKYSSISEDILIKTVENNNKSELKSSIETWFHLLINSKNVIHTHNVYINVLLCMKWWDKLLYDIIWNDIDIVDYNSPWLWLYNNLLKYKKFKEIIFLKNHWVIIHWNVWFNDLYNKLNYIWLKIKNYLNLDNFNILNYKKKIDKHFYPDSIVINDIENYSSYKYIINQIDKLWWEIVYLTDKEVDYIKNMKTEKYRKELFIKNNIWL